MPLLHELFTNYSLFLVLRESEDGYKSIEKVPSSLSRRVLVGGHTEQSGLNRRALIDRF